MSKKNEIPFREKLLSQEKNDTQLQQKFNLEAKKMYTENLKKRQRFAYILTSLLIAFITLLFWVFAKMFEEMQIDYQKSHIEPLRLASMWAMYLAMTLVILSMWPAIRGKVGLRFYPKAVRFIAWLLILAVVLLCFATVNVLNDEIFKITNPMIDILGATIISVLIIIMSIYLLLSGRIDRSDLKNKEKSLQLESRLTELEEKLNQKNNSKSSI